MESTSADTLGDTNEEESSWGDSPTVGKDVLIIAIDAGTGMFCSIDKRKMSQDEEEEEEEFTGMHISLKMVIQMLKRKMISGDGLLYSVLFYNTKGKQNARSLEHVYEFQNLAEPSADRIIQLKEILDDVSELSDIIGDAEVPSYEGALANALQYCGTLYSTVKSNKRDAERIWVCTNNDAGPSSEQAKQQLVVKLSTHSEYRREFLLCWINPPSSLFNINRFYTGLLTSYGTDIRALASQIEENTSEFPSLLRRLFRKRTTTTMMFEITPDLVLTVGMYCLKVIQKKKATIQVLKDTGEKLVSNTTMMCESSGDFLTEEDIRQYDTFGGEKVYLSKADMAEIKGNHVQPVLQLLCFQPKEMLDGMHSISAPYFIYPLEKSEGFYAGSVAVFASIYSAMIEQNKIGIARMICRKNSMPKIVALVPQDEIVDDEGQKQPGGLNAIILPYVDDVRQYHISPQQKADHDQVNAAEDMIDQLKLEDYVTFENPSLQKHFAGIQALALCEEMQFTKEDDQTLPDISMIDDYEIQRSIAAFYEACGGDSIQLDDEKPEKEKKTRKTSASKRRKSEIPAVASDPELISQWTNIADSNGMEAQSVPELKKFLRAVGCPVSGRKAELILRIHTYLEDLE